MIAQRRARPAEQHDSPPTGGGRAQRVIRPLWRDEEWHQRRSFEALEQVDDQLASRLAALEQQVELLRSGLDQLGQLRQDATRQAGAIGQLTEVLELLVARGVSPVAEPLANEVAALADQQRRGAREQATALMMLGLGLAPGFGALAWLLFRG
jgi:hypothetical protein